jgi:ABC-2 type transport system permease protein
MTVLPFLGSGFVPTATMPGWLQWFAAYQPFTPFTEVVRTLMLGTPMGASLWLSLGWIAVIGIGGWAWARLLYERKTVR